MNVYESADQALIGILSNLRDHGDTVGSRQGGSTRELLHQAFAITDPLQREILNPARKASMVAQIAETAWVLSGRDDVAWLKHYLPRAGDFSDDGITWRGAYGPRIRSWNGSVDQVKHVVDLIKEDPQTRRAVISIYDAEVDSHPGKDIPCNNWLQFIVRDNKVHLAVSIRSNDVIWGWSGINQFEWSVLLEVVAYFTGFEVGKVTYFVGSQHIYEKHYDRAKEIVDMIPISVFCESEPRFESPSLTMAGGFPDLDDLFSSFFSIEAKIRTGDPQWGRSVLDFPEPMLRSWLHVIAAYWTGDPEWMGEYLGTRFHAGWSASVKRFAKKPVPSVRITPGLQPDLQLFESEVNALHRRKHAAYGDSWRRRGEILGIMANIARKVDRLGKNTDDETAADTAIDLMNYLIKYKGWTVGFGGGMELKDFEERLHRLLFRFSMPSPYFETVAEKDLAEQFSMLESALGISHGGSVLKDDEDRNEIIDSMLSAATRYAVYMWSLANKPQPTIADPEGLQVSAERVAAWRPDKP